MKVSYHGQREFPAPVEDVRNPAPVADTGFQVLSRQVHLLHPEFYGLHGIWRRDPVMFALIILNEDQQDIQFITCFRPSSAPHNLSISART